MSWIGDRLKARGLRFIIADFEKHDEKAEKLLDLLKLQKEYQ